MLRNLCLPILVIKKFLLYAHELKVQNLLTTTHTCPVFTGGMAYAQCHANKLALTKGFLSIHGTSASSRPTLRQQWEQILLYSIDTRFISASLCL